MQQVNLMCQQALFWNFLQRPLRPLERIYHETFITTRFR